MTGTRRRVIAWFSCVAVVVAVSAAVAFVRAVIDVRRRAYAVWWTADLVVEYMKRHDGAWPRSWEDLRPLTEQATGVAAAKQPDGTGIIQFRPMASVDELKERVEIDWQADPVKLLKAGREEREPPFRVIYLRDGRSTHYEGREPNQMILEYLESRQKRKGK